MSSAKEKSPRSKLIVLLIFIPLLLVVLWRFTPLPSYLFRLANPPAEIENVILNDPIADGPMKQFKASFPNEFDDMVSYIGNETKIGSAAEKQRAKGLKFLRQWLAQNSDKIHAAPDEELKKLVDVNLVYAARLKAHDISICAKFSDKGYLPGDKLTEDINLLSQKVLEQAILTAKAGTVAPVVRATKPDQSTRDMFFTELAKERLTARQSDVLKKGLAMVDRPISPVDICAAGNATYAALSRMPPKEKAEFMARLFSRTYRPE